MKVNLLVGEILSGNLWTEELHCGCVCVVGTAGACIVTAQSAKDSLKSSLLFLSGLPIIIGMFGGLSLSWCCWFKIILAQSLYWAWLYLSPCIPLSSWVKSSTSSSWALLVRPEHFGAGFSTPVLSVSLHLRDTSLASNYLSIIMRCILMHFRNILLRNDPLFGLPASFVNKCINLRTGQYT